MRFVARALAVAATLSLPFLYPTVPASAAVTCSGGAIMTIDLTGGDSVTLFLSGGGDPLTIEVSPSDASCDGFDTSAVSTIMVDGTGGNDSVTIDQTGSAPFPHQNTDSIDLALGGGSDVLVVLGKATADTIGLGTKGISLDAGSTPDVTGIGSAEGLVVASGGGDDVVSARRGGDLGGDLKAPVSIQGGAGNDTLTGGKGKDFISGGSGNDTGKGGPGADVVDGRDGSDAISGGAGRDTLKGEAGKDRLRGGGGEDTLHGDDGNDTISGGDGADPLFGGDGNDLLSGNAGDDNVKGEKGRDQLSGGKGDDHCLGGPDPDSITGCESGRP